MKNSLLLILFGVFAVLANAQNGKQSFKVPSTYDRSSITVVLLDFPDGNHPGVLKEKFGNLIFSDKYYNNNVSFRAINAPYSRNDLTVKQVDLIQKAIDEKKLANEIVSKWYSRKSDGLMSLDLIHERGMFNATDDASLLAKTTKRGNAELEDYGTRLINRSYILVFDFQNLLTSAEAKMAGTKGWQSNVMVYLYKVDYSTDIQNAVYDAWIYNEDSPNIKSEKIKKFDQIKFPVNFITSSISSVSASQGINRSKIEKMMVPDKTEDQLLVDMIQKAYDENLYSLERKYEDFRVKTTIVKTDPLAAKVGKKEGIKTDYRFFAYEYIYNEKSKSSTQQLRGVIRASQNIADNRQVATGKSATTQFYQTAGQKLEIGYLLQQRNDFGGEVCLGYEVGNVGGIYGRFDIRLGRFTGIPSLFVYLEGGAESKDYNIYTIARKGISFVHYGLGFAKGLMITRNFELRPYVGVGQETASHSDFKSLVWSIGTSENLDGLKTFYGKGGANLSVNIQHNIQFVGGIGYYMFMGKPQNGTGKESTTFLKWSDVFDKRGGPSLIAGLKIGF